MRTPSGMRAALAPPGLVPQNVDTGTGVAERTDQAPMAPGPAVESRVMLADRSTVTFQPDGNLVNIDSQHPAKTPAETGPSPYKLNYGESDYAGTMPTSVAASIKINRNANPNAVQRNPTPFNLEGPSANTQYKTPSPWAEGSFIG